MNTILAIGIFLLVGLFFGGKLARILKLPAITGYIIAGFFIGPYLSGIIPKEIIFDLHFFSEFALGLICLSIGGKLKITELKRLNKDITYIAVSQSILSLLAVFFSIFFLAFLLPEICGLGQGRSLTNFILPLSLLLGAISVSTAPAVVMSVVNECGAKGTFTSTLLVVVAISNAISVIFFAIAFAISQALVGEGSSGIAIPILRDLSKIGGSLFLGLIIGATTGFFAYYLRERSDLLILTLGATMFATGLAVALEFSILMTNMAVGFTIVNRARKSERILGTIDMVDTPIYVIFFVLAGTHLDWRLLLPAGVLGITYVLVRGVGKVIGATLGAVGAHSPEVLRRYLGLALIPQAGVAIGFTLLVQSEVAFANFSGIISTIVMAGVLISELIGPPLTRAAIIRAGEASKK
jgi:Kef-type K+ transport system membrane component KefB